MAIITPSRVNQLLLPIHDPTFGNITINNTISISSSSSLLPSIMPPPPPFPSSLNENTRQQPPSASKPFPLPSSIKMNNCVSGSDNELISIWNKAVNDASKKLQNRQKLDKENDNNDQQQPIEKLNNGDKGKGKAIIVEPSPRKPLLSRTINNNNINKSITDNDTTTNNTSNNIPRSVPSRLFNNTNLKNVPTDVSNAIPRQTPKPDVFDIIAGPSNGNLEYRSILPPPSHQPQNAIQSLLKRSRQNTNDSLDNGSTGSKRLKLDAVAEKASKVEQNGGEKTAKSYQVEEEKWRNRWLAMFPTLVFYFEADLEDGAGRTMKSRVTKMGAVSFDNLSILKIFQQKTENVNTDDFF